MEPISIAASIIGVVGPALHCLRQLMDDIQTVVDAPRAIKCLKDDLLTIDNALASLQNITDRQWQLLGDAVVAQSRSATVSCAESCDNIRKALARRTRHGDGTHKKLSWKDRAVVGFFKQSQLRSMAEQLQSCKATLTSVAANAAMQSSLNHSDITQRMATKLTYASSEISSAITEVDGQLAEVKATLDTLSLAPSGRAETPSRPFAMIHFCRDPDFVDRGNILTEIASQCPKPPYRVALVGLGGVGKSQLVIEHAHRVSDGDADIWVLWVYAETRARAEESFKTIADMAKLPDRNDQGANIFQIVCSWLASPRSGRWLMILDSADHDDVFYGDDGSGQGEKSLASYLPQNANGSIIITTRDRSLASRLTGHDRHLITVGPMSEADAVTLLERKLATLSDTDRLLAVDLVRSLDLVPLAISQAAAYIRKRQPRTSLEKYLTEFRKGERRQTWLLQHEADDLRRDGGASNSILTTWEISFEHIRRRRPSAAHLLSLMSFFDRQGIPEEVVSPSKRAYLAKLAKLGKEYTTDSSDDSQVSGESSHEVDDKFQDDSKKEHEADGADDVEGESQGGSGVPDDNPQEKFGSQKYRPEHVESPGENKESGQATNPENADFRGNGDYQGKHEEGIEDDRIDNRLFDPDSCENDQFEDDVEVLRAYSLIGVDAEGDLFEMHGLVQLSTRRWLEATGQYRSLQLEFIERLAVAFPAVHLNTRKWVPCQRLLPHVEMAVRYAPANLTTGVFRSLLGKAAWYAYYQDNYELSERLCRTSVSACGPPGKGDWFDPQFLQATVLLYKGLYRQAESVAAEAAETSKLLRGPDHDLTISILMVLASVYASQGRHAEAEKLQADIENSLIKTRGPDDERTLEIKRDRAITLYAMGHSVEAERILTPVVQAFKSKFGEQMIQSMEYACDLALIFTTQQGRLAEAEEILVQMAETYKSRLGTDHPRTLQVMSRLARSVYLQNRLVEAEKLYVQVIEASKKKLGPDYITTSGYLWNLARVITEQGRLEEAEQIYQEILVNYERICGPDNPDTLRCSNNLADLWLKQGRLQEAEKHLARTMRIQMGKFGTDRRQTLNTMNSLSLTWWDQCRKADALVLMQRVMDGRQRHWGEDHWSTKQASDKVEEWSKDTGLSSSIRPHYIYVSCSAPSK